MLTNKRCRFFSSHYAWLSDQEILDAIENGLLVVTDDGSSVSLATIVRISGPSGNVLSPPCIELPSDATSPNVCSVAIGVLPLVPVPPWTLNLNRSTPPTILSPVPW